MAHGTPQQYFTAAVVFFAMALPPIGFFFMKVTPELKVLSEWQEVSCTIISSEFVDSRRGRRHGFYEPVIVFEYEWGGETYQSKRHRLESKPMKGRPVGKFIEKYPAGSTSTCYINPANPSEAVLSPITPVNIILSSFAIPLVLVAGFFLIGGIRAR
jgi:hypothetical protein